MYLCLAFLLGGCSTEAAATGRGSTGSGEDTREERRDTEEAASGPEDAETLYEEGRISGEEEGQAPDWAQGVQTDGQLFQSLNLDGIGDSDDEAYVSIWQFGDYEEKVTVLTVRLGTGETMAKIFPVYGFIRLQTGKIFTEDKEAIALEIGDLTSNYNAASLYILDICPMGPAPSIPEIGVRPDRTTSQRLFQGDPVPDGDNVITQRGTEITDLAGSSLQGVKVYTIDPTGREEQLVKTLYWKDGAWEVLDK